MIRNNLWTAAVALALAAGFAAPAQADPFSVGFGPSSSDVDGVDFWFNLVVPTTITGDATLRLTLDGDFNSASENALISIDGFSLGTVANGITADDAFDFANGDSPDSGNGAGNPFTGTAFIAFADIAPLIADGSVTILVNTSSGVGFSTTTVSGSLSFQTGPSTTPPVPNPEPGTIVLLGAGLVLLGLWRCRSAASV